MRAMDFTLNNMTLLGLTLAVGIVIDDAIVVLENIFRYIEEKDCTPFEAAIQGTREVALPVMATTLSLVVIFLPVAFMTGYARRFIYPFGWTMAFAIMVSMLVSFTLTPMLSSRFLQGWPTPSSDIKTKDSGFFHCGRRRATRASLEWSLAHPMVIIGVSVVVFAADRSAQPDGRPHVHSPTRTWASSRCTSTRRRARRSKARLRSPQEVVKEFAGLEGVAQLHVSGRRRARQPLPHLLLPEAASSERDGHAGRGRGAASARSWRSIPGCAPIVTAQDPLGGGERQLRRFRPTCWARTCGKLYDYSQQLLAKAQKTPSLVDAKTDYSNASPEVHVAVDRARAADLGVRMSTVGGALRLMVAGDDEISTYREGPNSIR